MSLRRRAVRVAAAHFVKFLQLLGRPYTARAANRWQHPFDP